MDTYAETFCDDDDDDNNSSCGSAANTKLYTLDVDLYTRLCESTRACVYVDALH